MDSLKILHSNDWHVTSKNPKSRTDLYALACIKKVNELGEIIKARKPDIATISGDLYHTPTVGLKLSGIIAEKMKSWNIPIYVVPGSHDMFGRDIKNIDQTMLGFLEKTGVVKILCRGINQTFQIGTQVLNLEGQEFYNDIDTGLHNDYRISFHGDFNILIVHSMLVEKPFIVGQDICAHTLIKDVKTDANIVLAGHYHPGWPDTKIDNTTFINRGSLLRDSIECRDKVEVTLIEVADCDGKLAASYEHIPLKCAKPSKEIFDLEANKEKKANKKSLESFKQILINAGKIEDTHNIYEIINNVLKEINATDKLKSLCNDVLAKAQEKLADKQDYSKGYIEKPYRLWIKEVELTNFRTHEHTAVHFMDGTNVITGEGSNGDMNIQVLKIAV